MYQCPKLPTKLILLPFLLLLTLTLPALAQSPPLELTATGVDDSDYPQVSVSLAVWDEAGPVSDLTVEDIRLIEGKGIALPTEAIVAWETAEQPINLTLVLDISMPDRANFAEVKRVSSELLASLGEQDRVTLLSFADEAELLHDFTDDHATVQQTVEGLRVAGSFTALHPALISAAEQTTTAPSGPQAVIVITDHRDNLGEVPVETAIAAVAESGVPFYVIGFGDKVQSDHPLKAQIGVTGGDYFTLPNRTEIEATVQDVVATLRQGYKVTFEATSQVADEPYPLTIQVTTDEHEGETVTEFMAVPGEVEVNLIGVQPGTVITEMVSVDVQAVAPGSIAAVAYMVDNQAQVELDTAPYRFEWNSAAVETGPHSIKVQVTDSVGNVGQDEVQFQVAGPPVIRLSGLSERMAVGEQIPLQIDIDSATPLDGPGQIEIFLDEMPLPGGQETFIDSSQYEAGEHTILVRVVDDLGQSVEASQTIEFLAPPPPPDYRPTIIRSILIAAIVLIGLLLILLILLLLRWFTAWQRRRLKRELPLALYNQGNIQSSYQLRLADPPADVSFQFMTQGQVLPYRQIAVAGPAAPSFGTQPLAVATSPAPVRTTASRPIQPVNGGSQSQTISQPEPESVESAPSPNLAQAKQGAAKAKETMGCLTQLASTLAGILDTLAALVPARMGGTTLRGIANTMRRGQGHVTYLARRPEHMARTAGRLKQQVGEVVPSKSVSKQGQAVQESTSSVQATSTSTRAEPVVVTQTPTPASSPITTSSPHPVSSQGETVTQYKETEWVETTPVAPGEKLTVDLVVQPVKLYQRKQTHTLTIASLATAVDNVPPMTEMGELEIKGLSRIFRFIILLLIAGLIAGVIFLAGYSIMWVLEIDVFLLPLIGQYIAQWAL